MINIQRLTKYYGKSRGIIDVDLQVEQGEIFGFIGPNGAGKSTTIRILLALLHPSGGKATINGLDCLKDSRQIKKIIGYVPSEVNFYDDMKVSELFQYSARFYGKDCSRQARELADRLSLDTTKKVAALSFGNKKKVSIIQALIHEPKVLIFDEPTSGLDPLVQNTFFELLLEEKEKGATILFSSHILSEVQRLCDRIAIIKDGKIIKTETIDSLRKNKFRQVQLDFAANTSIPEISLSGVTNFTQSGQSIRFLYGGEVRPLLELLSKNKIENVSIEEPQLEELFMHYYMEGAADNEFVS